jgi:hypothetical protein
MKRSLIVAGLVLLVAAGGVLAYAEFRPRPVQPARGDPAIAAAVSVGALLRSETHRLSAEQIAAVLPLLRVLRDTDPNDVEASRALADEIMRTFTTEQRAELTRLREEAQARRAERQAQGSGGPGFQGGQGGTAGMRFGAEVRRRLLDRLIRRLEGSV